jgi:sterol desaturase/sphingolipid hydroxylase (fatty acid hydroxylase superfamily)
MNELLDFSSPAGRMALLLSITFVFIAAEYIYSAAAGHDEDHDIRETAASIGVAIGDLVARAFGSLLAAMPFLWLYENRLMTWEFCYYWFHRASHRVRWLWATHAVHHSATRFNLSAAIRLGWTGQLTGAFVFFLPLAWLGFHPLAIGAILSAGLLYQFFLHTALPVTLGPLEWVLNTPSHHRVHHASNDHCLDKTYGNTLIIFDRLFGTYAKAPSGEPLRFGLKGREPAYNPIKIAFGEWVHLIRDVARAKGLRNRLVVLFGKP